MQLSDRIAGVTATYLEYEADRMGSEADEPCSSGHSCINGVRHCLAARRCIVGLRAAGGQMSAGAGLAIAAALDG
jgi:hypothetical protein